VWLEEGTSPVIAALPQRRLPAESDIPTFHSDMALASALLENVQVAQNSLGAELTVHGQALAVGQGVTAATSILKTGFGFNYFPFLHIGASSWYVRAGQAADPLQLSFFSSPFDRLVSV
jgi:hypothetical protein